MHFFQNSCTELAKIKNLHSTICLKVFPSSGRVALPPAFAQIEGRGVYVCYFQGALICTPPKTIRHQLDQKYVVWLIKVGGKNDVN